MKQVAVIDGQGGKLGQLIIEHIRDAGLPCEITTVGTNSIATTGMIRAGADAGATGENPVMVVCRRADVIIGPIGILTADSLLGEITPQMAVAVGLIAPPLRFVLFGMPPFPAYAAMAFELAAYGLVSGLLYGLLSRKKGGVYLSLVGAMLAGRRV